MISLLVPLGMAAAATVVIPLTLHLLRQPRSEIIEFAALRWLRPKTPPRQRLRVHRPWLLVLRILLLLVLALMLAMPVWRGGGGSAPWVGVAPGVTLAEARAAAPELADGLADGGAAEWHRLATGFPLLHAEAAAPEDQSVPLASLIRQLDTEVPAARPVTLIVPRAVAGLDGGEIAVGRAVSWRIVASDAPVARVSQPLRLFVHGGDVPADGQPLANAERSVLQALVARWQAGGRAVTIDDAANQSATVNSVDEPIAPTVHLWLGGSVPDAKQLAMLIPADATILVTGPIAAVDNAIGQTVMFDEQQKPLLTQRNFGDHRVLGTAVPLTPETMPVLLSPEFPDRLYRLLTRTDVPPRISYAGGVAPRQDVAIAAGPTEPLSPLLEALALLLFAAERLLALRRPTVVVEPAV